MFVPLPVAIHKLFLYVKPFPFWEKTVVPNPDQVVPVVEEIAKVLVPSPEATIVVFDVLFDIPYPEVLKMDVPRPTQVKAFALETLLAYAILFVPEPTATNLLTDEIYSTLNPSVVKIVVPEPIQFIPSTLVAKVFVPFPPATYKLKLWFP